MWQKRSICSLINQEVAQGMVTRSMAGSTSALTLTTWLCAKAGHRRRKFAMRSVFTKPLTKKHTCKYRSKLVSDIGVFDVLFLHGVFSSKNEAGTGWKSCRPPLVKLHVHELETCAQHFGFAFRLKRFWMIFDEFLEKHQMCIMMCLVRLSLQWPAFNAWVWECVFGGLDQKIKHMHLRMMLRKPQRISGKRACYQQFQALSQQVETDFEMIWQLFLRYMQQYIIQRRRDRGALRSSRVWLLFVIGHRVWRWNTQYINTILSNAVVTCRAEMFEQMFGILLLCAQWHASENKVIILLSSHYIAS